MRIRNGIGTIECRKCKKGCIVKTCVNRNKNTEENVVTTQCDHFKMNISIHTFRNSDGCIVWQRDMISFYLYATCNVCHKNFSWKTKKKYFFGGTELKLGDDYNKCCDGNEIHFSYAYFQNYSGEDGVPTNLKDNLEVISF